MSDDPQTEPTALPQQPAEQEDGQNTPYIPAQESFGEGFPATPPVDNITPAIANVTTPPAYGAYPPTSTEPPKIPAYNPYANIPANGGNAPYGYSYVVPPYGGYGYGTPPNDFPLPPVTPLPLGQAIRQLPRQYWRILTKPQARTFAAEQGKAAWNIIWMQILFLGLVEALMVILLVTLEFFLIQVLLPAGSNFFSQAIPIIIAIAVPTVFFWVILSFFIGAGILHLLARAFGGEGKFLNYAYSYALITVPIGILSIVLAVIPCIGSMASLAGSVYSVILLIYMTMGVHRLKGGKASAAVLIPIGTMVVLVVGAYVAYFIFIFSALSNVAHP